MRFAYGRPRLPTGFDLYSLLTPSVLPLNAEVKWAMDDPEAMPEVKPLYGLKGKRVWVAGHRGMVGSALLRRLEQENCTVLTVGREEVDLTRQTQVERWLADQQPQAIFLAAAKVGGILANSTAPAQFLYDNLAIAGNVIAAAANGSLEKLVFLGSSCIYPKFAEQPIAEGALLSGPLEPTNEWYAIAKIAGLKLCQAYRNNMVATSSPLCPPIFMVPATISI